MSGKAAQPDALQVERLFEREKPSSWALIANLFIGFLCLGVVLVVTLRFGEIERLLEALRHLDAGWIILAVLVQACSYVSATGVWYLVLKASGYSIGFRSLYPLTIAQLFAEQALPSSGLTGAVLVIKGLLNRGVAEPVGMSCMVVGMVSYYAAFILAILLSLATLAFYHKLNFWLVTISLIFCGVAVGVPAAVLWLRILNIQDKLPAFMQRLKVSRNILNILAQSPIHLLKRHSLLVKTTLLQLSVFFIDSATLLIMLHSVGYQQSYAVAFTCMVMAMVASAILPIPLGLGTFEGTCVAMLHLFELPIEAALVAVLLLRGFTFWLPMIPGLWLARKELHRPSAAHVGTTKENTQT